MIIDYSRGSIYRSHIFNSYVRRVGLEPTHPNGHRDLNPARLPIPPPALDFVRLPALHGYLTPASVVADYPSVGRKNGGEIISAFPFTNKPAGARPVALLTPVGSMNPGVALTFLEKFAGSIPLLQTDS